MVRVQTTRVYNELERAYREGYTTVSAQGSSRSGKTYNIILWLVLFVVRSDTPVRVSVVRGTLPALKASVLQDFKAVMSGLGLWDERQLNKSELVYTFPGGSVFEFFSASNEQRLRGRKRDILFVNEANELSALEFQQLKLRVSQFSIIDYNPSFTEDHWISAEVNRDPRTYHFITTYRDNPFLEQVIIDEIESLRWKNKTLWQVYGLGVQTQVEGLVFTNWDLIDDLPTDLEKVFVGVDYGFTHDPTAIVNVGISKDRSELYIDEIEYSTQMTTADIIRVMRDNVPRGRLVISESADPRLVEEILRARINITPVRKYPGSILAGVTHMLGLKMHITRRSSNVIKEYKNYTWTQDRDGKWLNVPIDAYNHAIDAVRYVVLEQLMGLHRTTAPIDLDRISEIAY